MLLVYVGFVAVILFMVVRSFGHEVELVTDDYYAEELKFQNRIDAEKNALPYVDSVSIASDAQSVNLQFPPTLTDISNGKAYFYKASDADQDLHLNLQPDASGKVQFDRAQHKFVKGFYTLKLSWNKDGKEFYMERNVYL